MTSDSYIIVLLIPALVKVFFQKKHAKFGSLIYYLHVHAPDPLDRF